MRFIGINDIASISEKILLLLFADDLNASVSGKTLLETIDTMNMELKQISNLVKCKQIVPQHIYCQYIENNNYISVITYLIKCYKKSFLHCALYSFVCYIIVPYHERHKFTVFPVGLLLHFFIFSSAFCLNNNN